MDYDATRAEVDAALGIIERDVERIGEFDTVSVFELYQFIAGLLVTITPIPPFNDEDRALKNKIRGLYDALETEMDRRMEEE